MPNNATPCTGTLDYTFTSGGSISSGSLGRALTGTLSFTASNSETIIWTVPLNSNLVDFTITLSNNTGDIPNVTSPPLTLTRTGSSEDYHVHLISGNTQIVDLYLGDDDQYVKIEKNAGNVVIGTNMSNNQWTFDTSGRTTFPVSTPPTTARGAAGDKAGMFLISGAAIYYCNADYTDGTVPIWQISLMDTTDWD